MMLLVNSTIISDGSEEKNGKTFEGKYEQNGDFVRVSYFDNERDTNCSLIFSKTREGFFRMSEKGDIAVSCECNCGRGEISMSLGASCLKFEIIDFTREFIQGGVKLSYRILYSQDEKADVGISITTDL